MYLPQTKLISTAFTTLLFPLLVFCFIFLYWISSPVFAEAKEKTVTTPYYTISLPSSYRRSIKAPDTENTKSVLIAFDNRFMKTASIAIEASPGEDIDIGARLKALEEKVERHNGSVDTLTCTNTCRAFYAVIDNQRKSEHFVLLETDSLRVDIQYLAEVDIDSAKAFILSIANQIHRLSND